MRARTASVEALRLYRDVLRACRLFDNTRNEQGHLMYPPTSTPLLPPAVVANNNRGDVLRASARKEFEAARGERDPEVIARLIITGRDCVMQIQEKVRTPIQCKNQSLSSYFPLSPTRWPRSSKNSLDEKRTEDEDEWSGGEVGHFIGRARLLDHCLSQDRGVKCQ